MIETNIRILRYGKDLRLNVRRATIKGHSTTAENSEKVCNRLSTKHGLSAVIDSSNKSEILVLSDRPVPPTIVEDENWRLEVNDIGPRRLSFANESERELMAALVERSLIRKIYNSRIFWTLDSYRIFYERQPIVERDGIMVARRFEVATLPIEDVGIGVVIDVSTAFFTEMTVADFFDLNQPPHLQKSNERLFNRLSQRQHGNKGTLLYRSKPNQYSKCYFDKMLRGVTAANTDPIRFKGKNFSSLQEYYKLEHGVELADDESVALVSFGGISGSVMVAASHLRLRVMNDALPRSLNSLDKIAPDERKPLVESFWSRVGDDSLGSEVPGLETGFWRPKDTHVFRAEAPDLEFGDGNVLRAPKNGNFREHKDFYAQRLPHLSKFGCFSYPTAAPRTLYISIPEKFEVGVTKALSDSIEELYSELTRSNTVAECIRYKSQEDAIAKLQSESPGGMVLFVFEDESPSSYFNVEFELKGWRVKRIKRSTLERYAGEFEFEQRDGLPTPVKIPRHWNRFIELNVMDLVQQIDGVPWTIKNQPKYQVRLGIDVSQGHRYFAVSLLIFQPGSSTPFRMETDVESKNDSQKETINEIILQDKVVELADRAVASGFSDLGPMLVVRDGRQYGKELDAIRAAAGRLRDIGFLRRDAPVDVVDFHKQSVKNIRLWEVLRDGRVTNALEGTMIRFSKRSVLLANTGAATLNQGTAEPVLIKATSAIENILDPANDLHQSCHLNWSNPRMAQRLPMEIKRTDEELTSRTAQEVRRIK
ncbi:MAG TPA: hypothetical protein PKD24_02150 [Pyrinomonadaceae bacterium]|nr:hypothetical protein [Pyrinomonadaceae bacterium]HMP64039.1 hypothetical protein [Pyrinomonadaceae bacterium]